MWKFGLIVIATAVGFSTSASALVIMDFESAYRVDSQRIVQGEFEIDMDGPFGFMKLASPRPITAEPQNGTKYVQMSTQFRYPAVLSARDNSLFDLFSIDLGEYSSAYRIPRTSTFTGYTSMGRILTQLFTVDGYFDGLGGLADYETFFFDDRWRSLSRVEFGFVHTFDNISLQTSTTSSVPGPGTLVLVLLGLFCGLHHRSLLPRGS